MSQLIAKKMTPKQQDFVYQTFMKAIAVETKRAIEVHCETEHQHYRQEDVKEVLAAALAAFAGALAGKLKSPSTLGICIDMFQDNFKKNAVDVPNHQG